LSIVYKKDVTERMLMNTLSHISAFFQNFGLELSHRKCSVSIVGTLVFNSTVYIISSDSKKVSDILRRLPDSSTGRINES
jgi:hypothetical protein